MNFRAFPLILMVMLTLSTLSCAITSRDIHVEITCDDFSEHPTSTRNDFEMETGDKLYVVLCSNPSTGFEWSYEMSDDSVVKEEDHDFESAENDTPGAAGKETWTFEATNKGTTTISMEYSQPWEGGIKREWIYNISIVVDGD